jgi:murein L,D-transpeptidase YafK
MLCFIQTNDSNKKMIESLFFRLTIFSLITVAVFFSSLAHAKKKHREEIAVDIPVQLAHPNPDAMLIDIYQNLRANNLKQAQQLADNLVEAYPQFQLGQLIRGDLLLMHTAKVSSFGAAQNIPPERLKDFKEEAIVRIRAIRDRPDHNLIPRNILQMRKDQKQIIVVDAKRSRLFLYEHQNGELKLVTDYYVSQGKFGIDKYKEGDQKTPIGVYYITSHLPGTKLPDFYGPGALPINYPNEWDKINGRSGSGIWLHGVPSDNFSRPPLASDGCIVLTNQDFLKIAANVDIGRTPVIIGDEIDFVSKEKWLADKNQANQLLDAWRSDMESMDHTRIMANYSKKFKSSQADNLNSWLQKQSLAGVGAVSIKLNDIAQFRYPGKEEMIVSTFTQETSATRSKSSVRKRQYWIKEAAKWHIIYESQV